MLSMKQILCEIESCVEKLKLCLIEKHFVDMPYFLIRMQGYNLLLQEIIISKLSEPSKT